MGKRYSIFDNSKIGKIFCDDVVDSINFCKFEVELDLWLYIFNNYCFGDFYKKYFEFIKYVYICWFRNRILYFIIIDVFVFIVMWLISSWDY